MSKIPYIRAETALTPSEREMGLMGRKHLAENSGMLFDFKFERPVSFWMKNTYIPLQIAFIDNSGKILQIESMIPMSTKMVTSKNRCRYALEVNDGWFDKNGIVAGGYVSNQSGKWARKGNEMKLFSQVVVPTPFGMPDLDSNPAEEDPNQQENQTIENPSMQILESWKDIFKRADELGVSLVIEWETKSGHRMPKTQVSPPYEFGKTSEGDHDGLLIAWSDREAHTISPIIENIIGVFDIQGNPINSVQQLEQIGMAKPMSQEEQAIALGGQEKSI